MTTPRTQQQHGDAEDELLLLDAAELDDELDEESDDAELDDEDDEDDERLLLELELDPPFPSIRRRSQFSRSSSRRANSANPRIFRSAMRRASRPQTMMMQPASAQPLRREDELSLDALLSGDELELDGLPELDSRRSLDCELELELDVELNEEPVPESELPALESLPSDDDEGELEELEAVLESELLELATTS